MGKEIERKFIVTQLPSFQDCPKTVDITQMYISKSPEIRIRKKISDKKTKYVLTVKGKGSLVREEFEIAITAEEFDRLSQKADCSLVKTRYEIPLDSGLIAEYDIYYEELAPLGIVEVEFESVEAANKFVPPDWFKEEVTNDPQYKNINLAEKATKIRNKRLNRE